jgi:hypothetical protein
MNRCLTGILAAATLLVGGCSARPIPAAQPKEAQAISSSLEQRKYLARVVRYDIKSAVMDAIPSSDTVHLDSLEFDILAPEDLKGKRWHLFIYNQVTSEASDYGYRGGDVIEIDVPKFGRTKAELDELMASKEWMCSVWISNELIKRLGEQATTGNDGKASLPSAKPEARRP